MPRKERRAKSTRRATQTTAERELLERAHNALARVPFTRAERSRWLVEEHLRRRLEHARFLGVKGYTVKNMAAGHARELEILSRMSEAELAEVLHPLREKPLRDIVTSGRWEDLEFCRYCGRPIERQTDRREFCDDECRRRLYQPTDTAARRRTRELKDRTREMENLTRWFRHALPAGLCDGFATIQRRAGRVVSITFHPPFEALTLSRADLVAFKLTPATSPQILAAVDNLRALVNAP